MWYLDRVATSRHICIHICAWPIVELSPKNYNLWSGSTNVWHFISNSVWLLPVSFSQILNEPFISDLVHMSGQISKIISIDYMTYIYLCSFQYVCLEDTHSGEDWLCDSCWYSESTSFLHREACGDDESGHLSLGITIWSLLCGFLYAVNAGLSETQ